MIVDERRQWSTIVDDCRRTLTIVDVRQDRVSTLVTDGLLEDRPRGVGTSHVHAETGAQELLELPEDFINQFSRYGPHFGDRFRDALGLLVGEMPNDFGCSVFTESDEEHGNFLLSRQIICFSGSRSHHSGAIVFSLM